MEIINVDMLPETEVEVNPFANCPGSGGGGGGCSCVDVCFWL